MTLTAFATYILQTSFAVSLLFGLVLLVRRPFAKVFGAKAAYALWAIPFLRLILPPMPANWTLFGLLAPLDTGAPETFTLIADPVLWQPAIPATTAANAEYVTSNTFTVAPETPQSLFNLPTLFETALPVLLGVWAIGMIVAFGLAVMRQRSTASLVTAESHDISLALNTLSKETQMRLGLANRDIAIKTSLLSSGPLVTGLVRPTVLLPEWFEEDYTTTEQRFALTHEMMHVKRGDLFALHAATFALALQWFNPLAWLSLRAFRSDQEAACDADVLALNNTSPHDYGATLVKAARMSRPVAQPVHAASLPLNHALQERLTIMKNPLPSARRRLTGSLLTASVGAAALIASACAASSAQTTDLAGGKEEVDIKMQVESIFISDDGEEKRSVRVIRNGEEIDLSDLDIEGISSLEVLSGLEGLLKGLEGLEGLEALEQLEVLKSLEGLEGKRQIRIITQDHNGPSEFGDGNVFIMKAEGDTARPDSAEFAAKIRELSKDAAKNQAEIQALAEDFETKMEAWAEEHTRIVTGTAHFTTSDFSWTGDGPDCDEGSHTRTVIVNRDDATGDEEKTVTINCSAGTFDTASIMADLRARDDLSEEKLAEIEAKLEVAKENLAATQSRLGKIKVEFDTKAEETDE